MWKLIAACLALAGVSLLPPSEPSYDPLARLIWDRELVHFHLDTNGGPSWKPLPVAFTTLFAPLDEVDHGLPPAFWMVVARAGGRYWRWRSPSGWRAGSPAAGRRASWPGRWPRWRCSSRPTGSRSRRMGARRRWPWC